ncbi:hypothetical protein RRF57_000724 [Xylaria bambusicola]|uniref:Uncharacterized protein n=1 Tax=Xylaria bambusicola TaxID=326684 RepID=A0AAN7UB80_9PEZI
MVLKYQSAIDGALQRTGQYAEAFLYHELPTRNQVPFLHVNSRYLLASMTSKRLILVLKEVISMDINQWMFCIHVSINYQTPLSLLESGYYKSGQYSDS